MNFLNPFSRHEAMASRAVDRFNAIPFVCVRMQGSPVNPNARSRVREGVERIQGKCVFEYISVENGLQLGVRKSYREANDLRALQVGRDPAVSFDRRENFVGVDLPEQGDIIYFPDLEGVPTFEITSVQPDGHSRVMLALVKRGEQPEEVLVP